MSYEKEIFNLWVWLNPASAFGQGIKSSAAKIWIPSHGNIRLALSKIKKIRNKTKNSSALKLLKSIERELLFEEPHNPPAQVLSNFYTHLVIEGVKEKHIQELALQSLNLLGCQAHLCSSSWAVEIQIFTAQNCDGAISILKMLALRCKSKQTKQALASLEKRLKHWKFRICKVKPKSYAYKDVMATIRRSKKNLSRKTIYPSLLKDWYDYSESPIQIEKLALSWINSELPLLNRLTKKLSLKFKCKNSVESVDLALNKFMNVSVKDLITVTKKMRKVLLPIAKKEWVKITPKYNVKVIATPPYLSSLLPTAAMQPFGSLTSKPFCIFFQTNNPKANPCKSLAAIAQVIIHEEYGHSVNFMNSNVHFVKKNPQLSLLESSLEIPITEGLSFFRELESLRTLHKIHKKEKKTKDEKSLIGFIEKFVSFEDFIKGVEFVVYQWRIVRFLRALSDSRVNMGKQSFAKFVDWANTKTKLSKELIFHQTFHFQEHPGYAPCYSVFGHRLMVLQKKAIKKGISAIEFNTFVASCGFPARSIFEKNLKSHFKL